MKKYHWHKRSVVGRISIWAMVLHVIALQCLPGYIRLAAAAEETEAPSELPQVALTLGAQAGEDLFEAYLDALVPVYLTDGGVVFVNPRFSRDDNSEEEVNIGLVYRHLFPDNKLILGGNVYYDSRWTQHDNQFNQLGLGLEVLTEWVDARANVYLPEDDEELVDRYTESRTSVSSGSSWGDIEATGHEIRQDGSWWRTTTTTTYLFERFEQAREGWDAEVGVKIPGIDQYAEVRVFGGYYDWEAQYRGQDDISGFKGRIEARVLPIVFLDATIYEDDLLTGSDWSVGGRINLPFDTTLLANGRNPFEGAMDRTKRPEESRFSDRLFEMVIRDLHVRTEDSGYMENEEARSAVSSTEKGSMSETILDDIMFVSENGNDGGAGTAEDPKATIQNGVDNSFGDRNVYVNEGDYTENVVLADNVKVYGSGTTLEGAGGETYGGGNHPNVTGDGNSPVFTMAENTTVAGFSIQNPGAAVGVVTIASPNGYPAWDVTRAGIASENNSGLIIRDNIFDNVSYGAVLVDTLADADDSFRATISGNDFSNADVGSGLVVDTRGASGTFNVSISDSTFDNNAGNGVFVEAVNFDNATLSINNIDANFNAWAGVYASIRNAGVNGTMSISGADLDNNGMDGLMVGQLEASHDARGTFSGISASDNGRYGISFDEDGADSFTDGDAFLALRNITAENNPNDNIYIGTYGAYADGGAATFLMSNVDADNSTGGYGVYCYEALAYAGGGRAYTMVQDVNASDNNQGGLYFGGYGAYGYYASGTVILENITANNNLGGDGLAFMEEAAAYAVYGDTLFYMNNVTLDYNSDYGAYFYDNLAMSDDGLPTDRMNARAVLMNVSASHNDDQGFYIGAYGAYSEYGNASLYIENSDFSYNGGEAGFYGYGAYSSGYGTADVYIDGMTANYNDTYGWYCAADIVFAADPGATGSSTLTIRNSEFMHNDDYGIYADGYGVYSEYGGTVFIMDNVNLSYNTGYDGFFIYASASYGHYGNSVIDWRGVTADHNGDYGLYVYEGGAYAAGDYGNATTRIVDSSFSHNGDGGLYFGNYAAYAVYGNATLIMTDLTADYNDGWAAIWMNGGAIAEYGEAHAELTRVSANYNGSGYGVYCYYDLAGQFSGAGYSSVGGATAIIRDSSFAHNDYGGFYLGDYGASAEDGDATFIVESTDFNYNGAGATDGSGLYASDGGAFTYDGEAYVRIRNVDASHNEDYGIYFGDYAAYAETDATFIMDNVNISYQNEEDGLFIGSYGVYAHDGTALMRFSGVHADYNDEYGMYFGNYAAYAGDAGGNAVFEMMNSSADWNGDDGMFFYESGPAYALHPSARTTFQNVSLSHNDGYGLYAYYGAYSCNDSGIAGYAILELVNVDADYNGEDGLFFYESGARTDIGYVDTILTDVSASHNTGYGIYFGDYGAYGETDGASWFYLTRVDASSNGEGGIYVDGSGARAGNANAVTIFDHVTASFNTTQAGVEFGNYGAIVADPGGHATFQSMDSTFNNNGAEGLTFNGSYAAYAHGGGANVDIDNIEVRNSEATYDGIFGLGAFALGVDNDAVVDVRNSLIRNNGADGVSIFVHSDDGDARLYMGNNTIVNNAEDNVEVAATGGAGVMYDLTLRQNSIYGAGGGFFDLNNAGVPQIDAENNWWGVDPPLAGQFNGAVDYTPWLTSDPN